MIQAKELRIDNLVFRKFYGKEDKEVREMILPYFSQLDRLEPIQVTKYWLFNLGFEYDKTWDRFIVFETAAFSLYASFDDINGFQIWFENAFSECPLNIEYVHQLQNLYYSLSGEELTLSVT